MLDMRKPISGNVFRSDGNRVYVQENDAVASYSLDYYRVVPDAAEPTKLVSREDKVWAVIRLYKLCMMTRSEVLREKYYRQYIAMLARLTVKSPRGVGAARA
jgi:hypothetical protein